MTKLEKDTVIKRLEEYEGWNLESGKLRKKFSFDDFSSALEFVNQTGSIAEEHGHHPDITLQNYNEVVLEVMTHSVESITEKDFELLEEVGNIFQ